MKKQIKSGLGSAKIRIHSVKNNAQVAEECVVANSFFSRLLGLMGRKSLPMGQGLLLSPCNDIHMWFMKIPIDVVFLDRGFKVVSMRENLRPWCVLPVRDGKAYQTLELPTGTIQRCQIQVGDELCIS